MKEQDNRRYPIGPFEYGRTYSIEDTRKQIKALERFPKELKKTVKKLRGGDLDKPYRTDGWTVRQVIHHIADSHINAYTRIKLAVTENTPIIKPYEEQLWAETEDGKNAPIKVSLKIISALHTRWVAFLESLSEEDLERGYYHPDAKRTVLVQEAIALYVWHSQHHLHHIQLVTEGKSKSQEAAMPSPDAMTVLDDSHAPKHRGPKSKAKPELATTTTGPKKRGMSEEHKAKIRAAHAARRIAKGGEAKPTLPPPAEGKRTRRTKEQMAADRAAVPVVTERKKPGPKPKSAASVASAAAAPAATKRIRRTKEQMATDRASAAVAQPTERRKPGRPAQPKAAKPAGTEPKKRGMSAEHMAKIREARMTKRAAAIAAGEITPKPKKEVASDDGAPKKRGMSAEHMAKIREARMAKRAAAGDNGAATAGTTKAAAKPKQEKTAASDDTGAPKKRGMSAEHMAKIREARMAKRAAALDTGEATATAKPKQEKAAASDDTGAPKKRGMSAEHMAKIREARMAKRAAAAGDSGAATATTTKAAAKPRQAASEDTGAPKKRGMSPEHMAKIREARMAKRAAAADDSGAATATTTKATAKPKQEKAAASDDTGAPKKRGMSPEHMAKIREARMAKRAESNPTANITPKPKKEKAAASDDGSAPKKRGMSAEHMAKIRAMRSEKKS